MTGHSTLLDRLIRDLRARAAPSDGQEAPAAILWTDPAREMSALVDLLLPRMPELLVLGEWKPERRSGPAIWLRCLVDGALDEPELPARLAPVIYLPGIERQSLRAGDDCPAGIQPLIELMYRGTLWHQSSGSDWTLTAWLGSPRGLGLDIARDQATLDALRRALPELALVPLSQLEGRQLQSDDFDRLLSADPVRDLLRWMCDPDATRARLGDAGWKAFRSRCVQDFDFDPEDDGLDEAIVSLARGDGAWATAWERFCENPSSHAPLAQLLRKSRVPGTLPFDRERWADLSEDDERTLASSLERVASLPQADGCALVEQLEREHGGRRGSAWARLGLAPLAMLLLPLSRLARGAVRPIGGVTPEDVASAWAERGWQVEAGAWEALALAPARHEALVQGVVRHLLLPWADDSARALQQVLARAPAPPREPAPDPGEGGCLVFVDGLRFDLGQRLAERLDARSCRTSVARRWSALPSLTATAKPAVTPLADEFRGASLDATFAPTLAERAVTARSIRDALTDRGWQVVEDASPERLEDRGRGWHEAGDVDAMGHAMGARIAQNLDAELERLAERVIALLDAGWSRVRLVTDHGWLLLPGGLPRVDLPRHLVAHQWARCAVIPPGAAADIPRLPWHWNAQEWFAHPPGIGCFKAGVEYAHGGVSMQECVTPDIVVERAGPSGPAASIVSVSWRKMRCLVEACVQGAGVTADLRLGRASGPSVAVAPKPVEPDGAASLLLSGDEHEAADLVLVLLDPAGKVLAQRATRAGDP